MWKRMQNYGREKDKTIGNPVLLDTTYDAETLERIPNISDLQSPTYPHAPQPQRAPQSYSLSPQSPSGDYQQLPQQHSSGLPPPPPGYRYDYPPNTGHSRNFSDISPPSSPEPNLEEQERQPRRYRSMRDVSPVDLNRGNQGGAVQHASNIPVLRKVSAGIQNKPSAPNKFWGGKVQPNSKVKWDEYSGEPTSGNKGKPAQVSPTTYAKSVVTSPEGQPLQPTYTVSATGPLSNTRKPVASERANRLASKLSPDETSAKPREPWRGASGRAPIAPPLEDQPLKTPPLFVKKRNTENVVNSGRNTPSSAGPVDVKTTPTETPAADTSPVADPRDAFDTHDDPIKPIVPLKVGRNSPPRSIASPVSPTSLHNPVHSYPSPITPTFNQPHGPGTVDQQQPQPQPVSIASAVQQPQTPSANTKIVRKSIEKTPDLADDKIPPSRFSWTTYNTSTTYQHSPPPSPLPPMPRLPTDLAKQSPGPTQTPPVLPDTKMPTRKPVTISPLRTRATTTPSHLNPPSPRPTSTLSTSTQKALPRPPPELATTDHIEVLEAQMADLRLRRSNVGRLLRDLNNQASPNPLVTDFKRMRLVEKRRKEFEDELDEIKREEHDVGLRLHRAWRRREREDPNGSECAIWVRRVTR